MRKKLLLSLMILPGILAFSACIRDPEPRRYTEISFRTPDGVVRSAAPIEIDWTLPDGWVVQPEGDPMRIVGFWAPRPELAHTGERDPKAVDVSLVQLAGEGGGLNANVVRWLGQVGLIPGQAEQAIAEALPVRTRTGETGIVVDFTNMLSGDMTQSRSIIGALMIGEEYSVFVRAIGDKEALRKVKPQVIEFTSSLAVSRVEEKP
jgi:hypothetical protein